MPNFFSKLFCGLGVEPPTREWTGAPIPRAQIRAMWPADLPQVMEIERVSFPPAIQWSMEDFAQCFAPNNKKLGYVIEVENRLVGFLMIFAVNQTLIMVNSIAILPAARRRGLGGLLLKHVEQPTDWCTPRRLVCLVRERNLAAQLFLRAVDFLPHPYAKSDEGAIKFHKRLRSKP
jgi:ribosomal protein S18 acetylase RimI-like enzyme